MARPRRPVEILPTKSAVKRRKLDKRQPQAGEEDVATAIEVQNGAMEVNESRGQELRLTKAHSSGGSGISIFSAGMKRKSRDQNPPVSIIPGTTGREEVGVQDRKKRKAGDMNGEEFRLEERKGAKLKKAASRKSLSTSEGALVSGDEETGLENVQGEDSLLKPMTEEKNGNNGMEALQEAEVEKFEGLGLAEWLTMTCRELGMRTPTHVQRACVPAILAGKNVVGIAQTGSGKTAAFALPILQKLALDPYGVFALVLTPTRELAMQLADQFRALGSGVRLRETVVIGGVEMTAQAQKLAGRPHVVIATPGRLRDHLTSDPNMHKVFARTQFLVLDEADRLLDVGFEKEMETILGAMPTVRQTLLFSATMTTNLKALQELQLGESALVYEAYAGFQTVESLKQNYIFIPANVKEVYLYHLMSILEDKDVRSAIVFTSTCRVCHLLSLTLAELGIATVALHSLQSQGRRLAALAKFRTGQVPILVATDVASRGLDIPSVELVVNYDIPRFTRDYVHRVGRTARAGRGGCAISFVTQYDVKLVHSIEALIGRELEEYPMEEDMVLKRITKVFKAKRTALLQISESGFDDLVKARREANRKGRERRAGAQT